MRVFISCKFSKQFSLNIQANCYVVCSIVIKSSNRLNIDLLNNKTVNRYRDYRRAMDHYSTMVIQRHLVTN